MADPIAYLPDGTPLEIGLTDGIPIDTYHQLPGVSASMLKIIREQSPAHLRWQMDHPSEPTPALILGAAIHDCVLLPEQFNDLWTAAGQCEASTAKGDRCSNPGKTRVGGHWFCGVRGHCPDEDPDDVQVLSAADFDTCLAVRDSVAAHPRARQLLVGDAEQSALWHDPATGVLCRGRYDLLGEKSRAIVDVKTTRSASRIPFHRDIYKYAYHVQASHYLRGAEALGREHDRFAFVAIEKEPPYAIALYELSADAIREGERELEPLLELYAWCQEQDTWPGYDDSEVAVIHLPRWAVWEIDDRLGAETGVE